MSDLQQDALITTGYPSGTNSDYTKNGSYIVITSPNGMQFAGEISIINPNAIKPTQEIAS